jgi:hypothetical protein
MYERILVVIVVLFCLFYTIRKIVGILRGRDSDGCAFCSGASATKGKPPCTGCVHRDACASGERDCDQSK